MTSSRARAAPWHALVQFHREVTRRAEQACFALPVTASAPERWSSITGFDPAQLDGPWEVDVEALASHQLTRVGEAFIGGPCWYRWRSTGNQQRRFEWIPLIYRGVRVEARDARLRMVPMQAGWDLCPLVVQLLEKRNLQSAASLDEMLPDLLASAQSKAGDGDHGLTQMLIDAFGSAVPELGALLAQARDDLPVDEIEFTPSPWVIFTGTAGGPALVQHSRRDYDELERHIAAAPREIGGLGLLEDASGEPAQAAHEFAPILPLNDIQLSAVESALAGRPVTVIGGPPGSGKSEVIVSILLNAWAGSTSVLFASHSRQAVDDVRERLKTFESDLEIAIGAGGERFADIDEALAQILELAAARRGESHFGGSPSALRRKHLVKKKHQLRELLADQAPHRVSQAIEAALASHDARRRALSKLESRRGELAAELRNLGIEDDPETVDERLLEPLRKWRRGIRAARKQIEADALRAATLRTELAAARAERDAVLAGYQIETRPDEALPWLMAEPGFASFEQALTALSDKLRDPIGDDAADASWEKAYDAWPGSEAAAAWERKARETASLIRLAGMDLKEKADELSAAHDALDAARRNVQNATKTSHLDARREDLDEWAACYGELCALPRSKLALRSRSRGAELVARLEELESRFRSSWPAHMWGSIGALDESGRSRLAGVVERVREWLGARERWERLSSVREEIEAETDALRRRLVALGVRSVPAEIPPAMCAAIASKLNAKASVAASAAAAWSRRERRERLPAELTKIGAELRAAGAGTPIKEHWMKGAGAPLMAALDALGDDPGMAAVAGVRRALLESAEADPVLQNWRRAYEAEKQSIEIAGQLEKMPSREARLAHWDSHRPASLPAGLELEGAFDDDDAHPVWRFLERCEEWRRSWAAFRDEEAPALERTADTEGAAATRHIEEAAQALPQGKERAWLEAIAGRSASGAPWPVEQITEKAALWRPDGLQAEIESIDAQLERIAFEAAKERWLERVAFDTEALQSLAALREHYAGHRQRIEKDAYPHFERSLKVQPVWAADPTSTEFIPLQPGLFDVLVIDDARSCTLTSMLPLIFRAKRLVVVGDPAQPPAADSLGAEAERTLAARFGIEGWVELFGHVGNDAYKAAVGNLPGRKVETVSLAEGD